MAFANTPVFVKVALILVLVGLLVHLIGFATNNWCEYPGYVLTGRGRMAADFNGGLWKLCYDTSRGSQCFKYHHLPSWFEATQAFETLGFIAAIAALILIILYVFVPQTSGKKIVFILSMLACFAAAGCIILGIIIYGANIQYDLSWSFALCTIAGVIFAVAGILLVVDMLKR